MAEEKNIKPLKFADICEHIPIMKLQLNKANLGARADL